MSARGQTQLWWRMVEPLNICGHAGSVCIDGCMGPVYMKEVYC